MTERDRARDLRSHLLDLHADAVRRSKRLARDFDDIVTASSDVATDDEHDPEGHTIAWERQQLAALVVAARATIADIEAALERLDDGTYGLCVACGVEISLQRLDAVPTTTTCLNCAARSP